MLDIPLPSPEAHDVERPLTAHAPSDRVEEELGWARGRVAGAVLLLWLWCLDRGAVTSDRHHARSSITRSWSGSAPLRGVQDRRESEKVSDVATDRGARTPCDRCGSQICRPVLVAGRRENRLGASHLSAQRR